MVLGDSIVAIFMADLCLYRCFLKIRMKIEILFSIEQFVDLAKALERKPQSGQESMIKQNLGI